MLKTKINLLPSLTNAFFHSLANPLIWMFVLVGNVTLIVCAFLFFHIEHEINPQVQQFFDAVWWAFCTVTTVGYGDIAPVTSMGRVVGIVLMLTGATTFVGFTAILVSGIISSSTKVIIDNEQITIREYKHIIREIQALQKRVDESLGDKR